jgi:predicted Zn-dependent protease
LARRNIAQVRQTLEQATLEFPDEPEWLDRLCQLLFEHGEPTEAKLVIERLLARNPSDAAAHHNLGSVYLRLDQPAEAIDAFGASVRLRPHFAATHVGLGVSSRGLPGSSFHFRLWWPG